MFIGVSILCIVLLNIAKVTNYQADHSEVMVKSVRIKPRVMTDLGLSGNDQNENKSPHFRYVRTPKSCKFPSVSEDADIFCRIFPSKVVCNQTCMYGYTLKEGRMRKMECYLEEDEWRPVRKFEKCKPYVDCTLSLGPGAKTSCRTHYMDHGPICEVSCQHYEDKESVPNKKYQCDNKGKWTPKLPFCVSAGSGIDLVPPPSDK